MGIRLAVEQTGRPATPHSFGFGLGCVGGEWAVLLGELGTPSFAWNR